MEILRLIINLVPSNELQDVMEGDVGTLPHFCQWSGIELDMDEILICGSEDISCAFYVFALPDQWCPYFVVDWPLDPQLWGGEGTEPQYLALAVIPMGWSSAVNVCQRCLRGVGLMPAGRGANLPADKELRKDRCLPVGAFGK